MQSLGRAELLTPIFGCFQATPSRDCVAGVGTENTLPHIEESLQFNLNDGPVLLYVQLLIRLNLCVHARMFVSM